MNPFKMSTHFTGLLLSLIGFTFLLNTGGSLAYYAQHFYLPSSEFADPFGGKRIDSQTLPMGGSKSSAEWRAQPKMDLMRAEDEGMEEGRGAEVVDIEGEKAKVAMAPLLRGNPTKAPVIPRRTLRHLLDEFGGGDQMGRQYKRMRPCFYSPIQCLMKRSSPS